MYLMMEQEKYEVMADQLITTYGRIVLQMLLRDYQLNLLRPIL